MKNVRCQYKKNMATIMAGKNERQGRLLFLYIYIYIGNAPGTHIIGVILIRLHCMKYSNESKYLL